MTIKEAVLLDQKTKEAYETVGRAMNGFKFRTLKLVLFNHLISVICRSSSSVDEAILQWNELSTAFDGDIRSRHAAEGLTGHKLIMMGDKPQ